ncbi:MAG TPA: DHA2 family efflux MFS transporter permease subunit [Kineosporiaceae bacterium]
MLAAPHTRRWWIVGALMLSMIVVGLDSTVLTVALPTLATDLHASTAQLQWVLDSYLLVLAGLMLPLGALADRIGRKPVLITGVAVFTLGSLAAAYTGTPGLLIATRAVMGLGAAVILTVPLAVLPSIFTPEERPRAIATMMVAMGAGLPLGPIVGGWLLERYRWGSVFLINVPVGVLAVVALLWLLPHSREVTARGGDLVGATASTAGLLALVYAVVEAPGRGWTSDPVLGFGALGVVLLGLFAWWERRAAHPMIDLGLLARPRFLWGTVCATMASSAMLGLLFVLPPYLQVVRGHDPLGTGVRLLPMIVGLVAGAKLGEAMTVRLATRIPVVAGLAVIVSGLLWGSTVAVSTGYLVVASWLTLIGLGMGLTMTPAMDAALGEVPPGQDGVGSALSMAVRQVGGALGVALLGSVLNAAYTGRLAVTGLPGQAARTARESVAGGMAVARATGSRTLADSVAQAYVHGMSAVMLAGTVLGVAGIVIAATLLPARRPAQQAADPSATIAV